MTFLQRWLGVPIAEPSSNVSETIPKKTKKRVRFAASFIDDEAEAGTVVGYCALPVENRR